MSLQKVKIFKSVRKLLGLLAIAVCLLILVLVLLPDRQYQAITENIIATLTGRNLSIEELKTVRSLKPSVAIKTLVFENPKWAESADIVSVGSLNFSIDLARFFKDQSPIYKLVIDNLKIDLAKNANGESNWTFGKPKTKSASSFDFKNLRLLVPAEFNLKNIQIDFHDQQSGLQRQLALSTAKLVPTDDGAAQLLMAKGGVNDLPFSINGKIASGRALRIYRCSQDNR